MVEKTGLAATGKVTISTKERVVLIHYYQNAIVATTLSYPDEVTDPSHYAKLKDLPEAGEEEAVLGDQDCGQDDEGPRPQSIPRRPQGTDLRP